MEVYRITLARYAADLSGNGARLYGGRWNSEGNFALYTSSSRSLALLETLAHTPAKLLQVKEFVLLTLFVPDAMNIVQIDYKKLPAEWDDTEIKLFTQKTGDDFLAAQKGLVLKVPSVLVPEETNFLLNPLHTEYRKVKIVYQRRIHFDKRMSSIV
jgi:RES domain-containing protein